MSLDPQRRRGEGSSLDNVMQPRLNLLNGGNRGLVVGGGGGVGELPGYMNLWVEVGKEVALAPTTGRGSGGSSMGP
jgi:hypothetical protein